MCRFWLYCMVIAFFTYPFFVNWFYHTPAFMRATTRLVAREAAAAIVDALNDPNASIGT